ncbi:MAG: MJ1477/TM1410 family putative glycoside hydrolase [bacterium]
MRLVPRIVLLLSIALGPAAYGAGLQQVNDWLYVIDLSDLSIEEIAASGYDLVVMDYSQYGDEESEFTPGQIAQLHAAGMTAVAYFSIGEAESYRFYWQSSWTDNPPSWMGPENPEWEGNYKVRYWDSGWKQILFGTQSGTGKSYLDRIIDQGFDGVYLDIVDAFEYWSDEEPELTRFQARQAMKTLVQEIRDYARSTRGVEQFLIFPQNAPSIIMDDDYELDELGREYLNLCDGIGAEDTWFNETDPQPEEEASEVVDLLDLFRSTGRERLVLCVDYVLDPQDSSQDRYNTFHRLAHEHGFLPYAAISDRDLNEIVIQTAVNGFLYSQPVPGLSAVGDWVDRTVLLSDK